ncbi:hypothetical protein [Lacticaseibacillus sharpeae]|uniref:DNA-directed RNA polymerase beta subunit n=2 Tax=Lacticaseibacillus sharpeae TaxID=1626 RepID=A0A0R1ZL38_9LACO|nr:hypothetical protein [Lacticaseibacillus sharpeae]KRM55058.1 hypothetical protein FC18_GL001766 [Lacticaseibacillus sharpeae JCM 1186 = DSM 20505]
MRDVPKEKWLYHDRCMAKWMGFFMSDHTEYMGRKASEKPAVEKRKMSEEECDSVFRDAWLSGGVVAIQMDSTFNDQYAPDIEGLVLGVDTNLICIQTKQGKMMRVVADDIRNVELLQTSEWWAA